jgi:hypothetical protein
VARLLRPWPPQRADPRTTRALRGWAEPRSLGEMRYTEGKQREAQVLLERAVVIQEAALGDSHPTVAATLGSLSNVLCDAAAAVPLLERAVSINEQQLGSDHPATVASRVQLEDCRSLSDMRRT